MELSLARQGDPNRMEVAVTTHFETTAAMNERLAAPTLEPGAIRKFRARMPKHTPWLKRLSAKIRLIAAARPGTHSPWETLCTGEFASARRSGISGNLILRRISSHLQCGFLAALPLAGALAVADAGAAIISNVAAAKQADALFAPWKGSDKPGLAVIVQRNGKVVYRRGFGMADLEHDAPITTTTPFHVASVSKQFTAFAIHLLVAEGKLTLDDDIRKYLPELHDFGKPVTVRHLLHHTSGLRDELNLLVMAGWRPEDVTTEADIFRLIQRQRALNSDPGREYNYCNTGYTLLALIVSRQTGRPFAEFATERIFKPLGMKHTRFLERHGMLIKNRAQSYMPETDGAGYEHVPLSYSHVGATNLLSTVEDLARWNRNLDTGRVGGKALIARMQEAGQLINGRHISYASGLEHGEYRGLPTIGHHGVDAGFRSTIERFPTHDFSVVILANGGDTSTPALARKLADIYLAEQLGHSPREVPSGARASPGATPIDSLLGDFALSDEIVFHFTHRSGRLFAQASGEEAYPLQALGDGSYFLKWANAKFMFSSPGPDGRISSAKLLQDGQEHELHRISAVAMSEQEYAPFQGEYYSEELHTLYTITGKGGQLVLLHPKGEMALDRLGPHSFVAGLQIGRLHFQCPTPTSCIGATFNNGRVRDLQFTRVTITGSDNGRRVSGLLPATVPPRAPPFATESVYLRGSMNEWQAASRFIPSGPGLFTLRAELERGNHEFKLASADFKTIDFGAVFRDEAITPGQPKKLEALGANITLTLQEGGVYGFTLDASNPFEPVLTIDVDRESWHQ
jgi:CubicO group peptidase (beta-lactamase class C family)